MSEKGSKSGSGKKASRTRRRTESSKSSLKSSGSTKSQRRSESKQRASKRSSSRSPRSSPSPQPVIGLDLSLTATGLVVWDGERVLRARRYKTEPVSPSEGLKPRPRGQLAPDRFKGEEDERIEWLRKKVRINIRKFPPKLVVIEGHAFMAKGRGKTILSELAGVIKNELLRHEIPYVLKAPNTIKLDATGNGHASKTEMVIEALRVDKRLADSDTADAFHCARYGERHYEDLLEED